MDGRFWLCAILLANLALGGWLWQRHGEAAVVMDLPAAPELPPVDDDLVLLSERNTSGAAPSGTAPPTVSPVLTEQPSEQPAQQLPEHPSVSPVAAPDVMPSLEVAAAPPPIYSPRSALSCAGPFESPEQARDASGDGEQAQILEAEVSARPDYLVWVDANNSREQARRLVKELQGQGLESYLISKGEFSNTISVGVFSQPQRASSQLERVRDLGYTAEMTPLDRSQTVYYAVGSGPSGAASVPCVDIAQAAQLL